eukprot:m.12607 g.12607  ORF g.12607 m.12607 type:complete len:625 (-) comp4025_c0_seq1:139-2013(-)
MASDLEVEVELLRELLREKDDVIASQNQKLHIAGQQGNGLLQQLHEFSQKNDALLTEKSELQEQLEQSNHEMAQSLLKLKAVDEEKEYFMELEQENQDLKDQVDKFTREHNKLKQEASSTIRSLEEQVAALSCSEGEAKAKVEVLAAKVKEQQEKMVELEEHLRQSLRGEDLETKLSEAYEAISTMQEQITSFQLQKCQTNANIVALENKLVSTTEHKKELQSILSLKTEQLDNAQRTADSYANDIHTLQCQLDEYQTSNNMGTGTDLFSEVEEKRLALERRVGALQGEAKVFKLKFASADTMRRNLRQQLMTLMGTQSSKADEARLRKLEETLSQTEGEKTILERELKKTKSKLEKQIQLFKDHHAAFGDEENTYAEFLQTELDDLQKQNESLHGEVNAQKLKCLSESGKVREANKLIHKLETRTERLSHDLMQKQMEIDELNNALEMAKDMENEPLNYICKQCKTISKGMTGTPLMAKQHAIMTPKQKMLKNRLDVATSIQRAMHACTSTQPSQEKVEGNNELQQQYISFECTANEDFSYPLDSSFGGVHTPSNLDLSDISPIPSPEQPQQQENKKDGINTRMPLTMQKTTFTKRQQPLPKKPTTTTVRINANETPGECATQ